eukprot:CAMPEP_0183354534 /NCGR_PEP_ID=MMETSP0164_2-20130417/37367_1 /TAXON_ID=221442 /ORGANISM="Coccolithus pelagicus ssp braarudi, Strain PLY182g" /LENGTH=134 /DNA_ID=CAMNT_0025527433 /DNA_START=624 /DNA_END=1029 /DNA_ORIENTATION=+
MVCKPFLNMPCHPVARRLEKPKAAAHERQDVDVIVGSGKDKDRGGLHSGVATNGRDVVHEACARAQQSTKWAAPRHGCMQSNSAALRISAEHQTTRVAQCASLALEDRVYTRHLLRQLNRVDLIISISPSLQVK